MNRILLILLLFSAGLAGCSKTNNVKAQIATQATIDDKIITNYLKAKNITASVVDSAGVSTGIYYTIDTLGTGSNLYTSSTQVTVGYKGTLLTTGVVFSQTGKYHPSFVLGTVIRGWQLGIPKVQQGGTITLYLPSKYAYGPFPQPSLNLPANAILIFNIKVYNITN
ncbi:MAG: FKBP-type peptidyl-prolyl cis-trans isomerase FkpA [Mucilaginibacter sp.]|nr:FKBP-type peptidyl-prolyl cis-trans isomerase FkpA [Mucilaginibacter sp.]